MRGRELTAMLTSLAGSDCDTAETVTKRPPLLQGEMLSSAHEKQKSLFSLDVAVVGIGRSGAGGNR